jgi:hypothetical protein
VRLEGPAAIARERGRDQVEPTVYSVALDGPRHRPRVLLEKGGWAYR